jgi:allantoate deiminase
MMGIVAAAALQHRELPLHLEVIGFSEEEGVRFKTPFLGSKALTGQLDAELLARSDDNGTTVVEAIRGFGLVPENISQLRRQREDVWGYLEVHIEQGPVLEDAGVAVAAVNGIIGQSRYELEFIGRSAHAGTTPMNLRHDALAAAAAVVVAVEHLATTTAGLVATVGQCIVPHGAGNVVPGRAIITLDIRHLDDSRRQQVVQQVLEVAHHAAQARGVVLDVRHTLDQASVVFDQALVGHVEAAIARLGLPAATITSGAGHDAMVMAQLFPTAMIFVRSPGGISHHPDESVGTADVACGLRVLLATIEQSIHHYTTLEAI